MSEIERERGREREREKERDLADEHHHANINTQAVGEPLGYPPADVPTPYACAPSRKQANVRNPLVNGVEEPFWRVLSLVYLLERIPKPDQVLYTHELFLLHFHNNTLHAAACSGHC